MRPPMMMPTTAQKAKSQIAEGSKGGRLSFHSPCRRNSVVA
jgi:hypothetical protein